MMRRLFHLFGMCDVLRCEPCLRIQDAVGQEAWSLYAQVKYGKTLATRS